MYSVDVYDNLTPVDEITYSEVEECEAFLIEMGLEHYVGSFREATDDLMFEAPYVKKFISSDADDYVIGVRKSR